MYFSHALPTHTYFPSDSFTPCLGPTLLYDDDICPNTWQNSLVNLRLNHLSICSEIMFRASLTPMHWSSHAFLYQIYIGTIDSSPFDSHVLISLIVRNIFNVSGFHILCPIHCIIGYRRLWVASWYKPLYYLDLNTASKITCRVLSGVDEFKYLYSKSNLSSFICIQIYSGHSHKLNIFLFKRRRLTYTNFDITSGAITQCSHFSPTRNNPQFTTVLFPCQHTKSLIWLHVPRQTCFPPSLASNHPIIVRDAQVFSFIVFILSSVLIIKFIFLHHPLPLIVCSVRSTLLALSRNWGKAGIYSQ